MKLNFTLLRHCEERFEMNNNQSKLTPAFGVNERRGNLLSLSS